MDGIHPKFVLSKRFPVHAAIEQLNLHALKDLLTPVSDARFHFGRKLTATDISVLHQACANRPQREQAVVDIVKLCTALGAPVNDIDVINQTPLFYAVSHCQAAQLVPILLKAGAHVNKQRAGDGWTPLFIAAMLGRLDIATLLLQAGADSRLEDEEDRTAEMIAHQYGHHMVADIINSPRDKYRPQFPTQFMEFLKTSAQPDSCTILWDEHIDWRDESGCTLLHIACWTGNIELFKLFCGDSNGRKLLALSTTSGLSPLMFAIINGQSGIIEEYLTNRNSKNTVHFNSDTIKDTKQTIPHLLFQHCPTVHPKFILKRKDLTPEIINALDHHGNTSLLKCAIQNSRDTIRRLLSSKAATERHLIDLSVQNMYGKTALHYLVINNDKHNVRLFLNLLEDSGDALNAVDVNEMSPIAYCLAKGHNEIAALILTHPKSKSKLNLEAADSKGRTLVHLAAETGNFTFWRLLTSREDYQPCLRDDNGNTPLMAAAINKQNGMITSWLASQRNKHTNIMLMAAQNSQGLNLFMLVISHMEEDVIKKFIETIDLSSCIDQVDSLGNNALLLAASHGKWDVIKQILSDSKLEDLAFDVHPKNKDEYTTLVLVLIAKVKISRQETNFKMKNDKAGEKKMQAEGDFLWEIVKLLLGKERDFHGSSPASGKESGCECIQKQIECNRQIKTPLPEDVIEEFSKLYRIVIKAKKKPEQPPEAPKQEPKKTLGVSKFQQQMNDIYNQSEKEKKPNAPNPANALKIQNGKKSPIQEKKVEPKPSPKIIESNIENGKKSSEESNGKHTNGNNKDDEKEDDGPSFEEIRAQWKKKRPEPATRKVEEFDVNSVFEDLMKKAEEKVKDNKVPISDDEHLAESMNEEIMWAIQQKKQHEEENRSIEEKRKLKLEKEEAESKAIKEKEERKLKEETDAKAKAEQLKEQEILQNLAEAMEKKAENRRLAKLAKSNQMSDEERRKKEEQEIQDAMSEEISWAMEQKAQMAEQRKEQEEVENRKKQEEENERTLMQGIVDRQKAKEKAEEERLDNMKKEQDKLLNIQKEAEEKIRKAKEDQRKLEEKLKEEDESFAKLPKWKKDKMQRDRLSKDKEEETQRLEKEKKEKEDKLKKAQKEEEEYKARLEEEMDWARQLKNQQDEEHVVKVNNEHNLKKEEANNKEKERQRVLKEEQELIEKLEKQAMDKIEKTKKEQEMELANWQKQKLIRENEAQRKEQEEMDNRLAEELIWAEEIKIQTQKDKEEEERKEKEKIEEEKRKVEEAKKEKERQKKAKAEKEMLERLEIEATEKLRIQKEEEEKRIKEEQEAWEKMPRWKKEKILRERKGSLTSDSSRKNSLVDSPEKNSPIGTPLRKDSLKNSPCDSPKINGLNGQGPKLNVIINKEQIDNSTSIKKECDAKTPEVLPVSETDTPEDFQNDKFSEWLEKELKQTERDPSESAKMALDNELKPPAPVRRKRIPTGDETEEAIVPVTRPTRKSRVGDNFNHEKSPSLSTDSSVPSTAPVATTRNRRSKPEIPSLASTETGDGVTEGDWYWDEDMGWVQQNGEANKTINDEKESESKSETASDGDWYWDDDNGWVQENVIQTKDSINETEEGEWYWDDENGWVQENVEHVEDEKESQQKEDLAMIKENERKRQLNEEKEKIEHLELLVLSKLKEKKDIRDISDTSSNYQNSSVDEDYELNVRLEDEMIWVNEARQQEELEQIEIEIQAKEKEEAQKQLEREVKRRKEEEKIYNLEMELLAKIDKQKEEEAEKLRTSAQIQQQEQQEKEIFKEGKKEETSKIWEEQSKSNKDDLKSSQEKQKELERQKSMKIEKERIENLEKDLLARIEKVKQEEAAKLYENSKREQEEEEKLKKKNELKIQEQENYELQMRLEEEMKWANELRQQQEQEQLLKDEEVKLQEETKKQLEREQKRKEEEENMKSLEDILISKINKQKEEDAANLRKANYAKTENSEEINCESEQAFIISGTKEYEMSQKALKEQKELEQQQNAKMEKENIQNLEKDLIARIERAKQNESVVGKEDIEDYELKMRLEEEIEWATEIKKQQEHAQKLEEKEARERKDVQMQLEREKRRKEEELKITFLELELLSKINKHKEEEAAKLAAEIKTEQEYADKLREADEKRKQEEESYQLKIRLEEEMKWANELRQQQEHEQKLTEEIEREKEEVQNKLERERRKKEEETKIANLEVQLLSQINKQKELTKSEEANQQEEGEQKRKRTEEVRRERQFELMQEIEVMEEIDWVKVKTNKSNEQNQDELQRKEEEKEQERQQAHQLEKERIENLEKELLSRILKAKQEEAEQLAKQKRIEQEENYKRVEEEIRREEEIRLQEQKEREERERVEQEKLDAIKRKEEAELKEQERKRRIKEEKEMLDKLEQDIMQKLLMGKK